MELLIRLRRTGAEPIDLRVDIDAGEPVARLARELAVACGLPDGTPMLTSARTGQVFDLDDPIGRSGISSGDELHLGGATSVLSQPEPPPAAVTVDVLSGPDTGRSRVLAPRRYVVGRDADADLPLADPTVSRHHAVVELGDDGVLTIEPSPEAANGVRVNGVAVEGVQRIQLDDVVEMGSTSLAFRAYRRADEGPRDQLGQVPFNRTPYRPPLVVDTDLPDVGPVPTRPEPQRFQVLSVLAPLGGGLAMFAFTKQVHFLAIILLSPLAMVGNWYESRRSGRHRFTEQVARFEAQVEAARDDLQQAKAIERQIRVRSAPDLADLTRRADLRTVDLWPRHRLAPDFLQVRLGLGDVASRVHVAVAAGGDDDLRTEADGALAGQRDMPSVPIAVNLAEVGVIGLHGSPDRLHGVVDSMVAQLATLHSTEDLVITAAVHQARPLTRWAKWLPHTRSITSPLGGHHLVHDADAAAQLLRSLVEVADTRLALADQSTDTRWPWIVLVLDAELHTDPAVVSQVLQRAPVAGIAVICLASSIADIPRQARAVVDLDDHGDRLWFTDPDDDDQSLTVEMLDAEVAEGMARRLAPVRDASASTPTTAIPRVAPLLSVLGTQAPDAAWILDRWERPVVYGLSHALGLGADGVFRLDLVADGPHALIGGTSGAGKSELLQSMVASLITEYPPTRLNFLFVDYKGGASSTVFRDVPHTVGYVTNLDAALSMRALVSLRAELNRRMRLMEGRAKDLEEMLARFPDEAPPSLVIVVDEFATLVKEVPDFVAGVVDIAQRGRSLGIHLILATQRPSGSVNDNILANTNLRISLRMLDALESTSVISSPDAAAIPVPLRGRGFARTGPRELVPFQSAFAGATLGSAGASLPVRISTFTGSSLPEEALVTSGRTGADGSERTHLDAVLEAIAAATAQRTYPPSRSPWTEMLPTEIPLADVLADDRAAAAHREPGRFVVLGVVDDPGDQDQYPALVDLEESGGLLVFGSGGSGKTTLLRTVAGGLAQCGSPDEVALFALDFASRALHQVTDLPHTVAFGAADDLESVTRVIARLSEEVDRRRSLLAEHRAETLTAYLAQGRALPRIVLLIDGYQNVMATLTGGPSSNLLDRWFDDLNRVIVDGRQVGIHAVITADRRSGVSTLLHSAIGHRIVLRQSDLMSYGDYGIAASKVTGLTFEPGRGIWPGDLYLQVAALAAPATAAGQSEALAEIGTTHQGPPAIITLPLPERVARGELEKVPAPDVALGLADLTLATATVDVVHSPVLIAGPARSGRSTAAATLLAGFEAAGYECWVVGPASSPLAAVADPRRSAFGRTEVQAPILEDLATRLDEEPTTTPRILVADDLDRIQEGQIGPLLDRLTAADGLRVVATVDMRNFAGFTMNSLLTEVRTARRVLVLGAEDPMEFFQVTGVRWPFRPGLPMPTGRAVLITDRRAQVVQVAVPDDLAP